ncbi:hypothetical protein [Actinomadura xylanilytica]|uniref:hypothetical protein n=1 Tax=Actinomadura xylanilytica TaxID=887459 RepID=UPI00255AB22E|nr:hypothetical protein [Actinomadura xylanilytica]MDL4775568.1 hypothetical protein [Actinomadura xylanilytica]
MTMAHGPDELTIMLRERTASPPANPRRGEQAAARGRRALRRRRACGAALSAGAVAAVVALPGLTGDGGAPADVTPMSVRLPPAVPLPGTAGDLRLPLAASARYTHMGEPVRLTFTALSVDTVYNVRCSVPDSWLVVESESPGRETSIGRCGPQDHLAQYDRQSAGPAWAGRAHTWRLRVLPPGTRVDTATFTFGKVTVQPGAWAVGIYDRRR